jgi:paired amphipathic helix protein Sin3a
VTRRLTWSVGQVLYSRLHLLKNIAIERANDPTFGKNSNATAMEVELKQAMSGSQDGQGQGQITALQYYELMLETCERLFDNQVEQFIFEDQMREMFGLHARFLFSLVRIDYQLTGMQDAYKVFTIDKVLASFIKHVRPPLPPSQHS